MKKFFNYLSQNKKTFAKGICFEKLFFIFLIASIIGAFYEQILNLIIVYFKYNRIVWENRRGVIYGPFNVIYGFGSVVMIQLLASKNYKSWQLFLYGCLLGSGVEYLIGFLQETFTQTISWNYSNHFLNINGRTSFKIMLVWGLFTLLFIKKVYPFLSKYIEKIPYNLGMMLTKILVIFMIFNMIISWGAIIRQTLRKNEVPPITSVGRFFDEHYPDEFLQRYFPNMISTGGKK